MYMLRIALLVLPLVLFRPALAQDVATPLRDERWPAAEAAAAQYPDPVVRKLVTYYRMLDAGSASAAEIAAFMAENPDWPLQGSLAHRRDEALASETDDATAATDCARLAPQTGAALARCADAYAHAGQQSEAEAMARHAWVVGHAAASAYSAWARAAASPEARASQ